MYMWRSLHGVRRQFDWRRLVGVCGILLVLLGASAELNHSHDSGSHDAGRIHPDCSLCVVAHSAAQATVYTVATVVLRPVSRCADPEPIFRRRSLDIRLSIRPPPVAPHFA
jgi:hypothetical protein